MQAPHKGTQLFPLRPQKRQTTKQPSCLPPGTSLDAQGIDFEKKPTNWTTSETLLRMHMKAKYRGAGYTKTQKPSSVIPFREATKGRVHVNKKWTPYTSMNILPNTAQTLSGATFTPSDQCSSTWSVAKARHRGVANITKPCICTHTNVWKKNFPMCITAGKWYHSFKVLNDIKRPQHLQQHVKQIAICVAPQQQQKKRPLTEQQCLQLLSLFLLSWRSLCRTDP